MEVKYEESFNNVKAEENYAIYSGSDRKELTLFSDYFVKTDGTQYQIRDFNWINVTDFSNSGEYSGKFDDGSRNNSNNTFCLTDKDYNGKKANCNVYSKMDGTLTKGKLF